MSTIRSEHAANVVSGKVAVMVSALEKELSEAISDEANDAHKTPDSV
ncbi:hypothetical protein ACLBW2_06810 [Enterobacteriaceae bacterium C23F]